MRLTLPTQPAFAGLLKPALPLQLSSAKHELAIDSFVSNPQRFSGQSKRTTFHESRIALTTMAIEGGLNLKHVKQLMRSSQVELAKDLSNEPAIGYRSEGDYFTAEAGGVGAAANTPLGLLWIRAAIEPSLGLDEFLVTYLNKLHLSSPGRAFSRLFTVPNHVRTTMTALQTIKFPDGNVPSRYTQLLTQWAEASITNPALLTRRFKVMPTMGRMLGGNLNLAQSPDLRDWIRKLYEPTAIPGVHVLNDRLQNLRTSVAIGLASHPGLETSPELLKLLQHSMSSGTINQSGQLFIWEHLLARPNMPAAPELVTLGNNLATNPSMYIRCAVVESVKKRWEKGMDRQSPELIGILRQIRDYAVDDAQLEATTLLDSVHSS